MLTHAERERRRHTRTHKNHSHSPAVFCSQSHAVSMDKHVSEHMCWMSLLAASSLILPLNLCLAAGTLLILLPICVDVWGPCVRVGPCFKRKRGSERITFIQAFHFSIAQSVNNLDPAERLIKPSLSAPITAFSGLKFLVLSQGIPQ